MNNNDKPCATDEKTSPCAPLDLTNIDANQLYLNRELTWLAFNERVLYESSRRQNPLLERVKFIAIVNANLDEFFMKRIGGLKQQVGAHMNELSADGRTAQQQIDICYERVQQIEEQMNKNWEQLIGELSAQHIEIVKYSSLPAAKQQQLRDYYYHNIYPLVTPQAIDPAHPFPFVSNLSLNLLVRMSYPQTKRRSMARVKIPVGQGSKRFINIGDEGVHHFVTLEDLIISNLDMLFPEMEIENVDLFRGTRNAVTEKDEEKADDLLELIEGELRERRFAPIVRMQYGSGIDPVHKGMLAAELNLDEEKDVCEIKGLIGKRDLFEIAAIARNDLKDSPHHPVDHERLVGEDNIFHAIRRDGPFLIQLPYESFNSSVERFLRDASRDPKVLGIKMTLYRTSSDSKIIEYLIDASRNGKQVTVVVEVKARFDESANIRWANHLEEAGLHVTYGIVGLKTHAKIIYVIRQDYDGLRRYAHIGTGNYHSGTARAYSDLGILTCDDLIGEDLTELFNYLTTGYTPNRRYHKLLPAPKHMKAALLARIEREIQHAKNGKKAWIRLKSNALEDVDITKKLYEASQANVRVELIIRDTCRLIAGVPGLSENITVISIVGRFLEHTRIYHFHNDGNDEYYIGSADLMHRNLQSRVEVLVPLEAEHIRKKVDAFLTTQLNSEAGVWQMQNDGSYRRRENINEQPSAQQCFIENANKRYKEANRLQHRKTKAL